MISCLCVRVCLDCLGTHASQTHYTQFDDARFPRQPTPRPPPSVASTPSSKASPPTSKQPPQTKEKPDGLTGQDAPLEPAPKTKGKTKAKPKAKTVNPESPLEKGEELARQILKTKGQAQELSLQLATVAFGSGVKAEVDKFCKRFECLAQLLCFHTCF